ncbi:RNase H family protein [Methanobrevibacter sp.]|uniref:RNase H family protein n=1 Tax=Methanobrevibacter sp. TaxID=66852 RepID=UPI00388E7BB7
MKDFLSKADSGDVIEICSDSSYCIDIFTKWVINWQKNGWKRRGNQPIENLEIIKAIWKLMDNIKNSYTLSFVKVKGHSSNRFNIKADKLAVNAKQVAFNSQKTVAYGGKKDNLLGGKSKYA